MKTVLISITRVFAGSLLISFALSSCNQAKTGSNETTAEDSVNVEQDEAEERAKAEALAKDSLEYTHFTSADLGTFFLHGRVKTLTETENGMKKTFHFNTNGKLIKFVGYDDEPAANKIYREKNRISGLGELQYAAMSVYEFEYDGNGRCKNYSEITGHGYTKYTYASYNDNGWPLGASVEGGYMHMGTETESSGRAKFSYVSIDENGNWTKRVESGFLKITGVGTHYDPYLEEDVEMEINETEQLSSTVVRSITYYTREDMGE